MDDLGAKLYIFYDAEFELGTLELLRSFLISHNSRLKISDNNNCQKPRVYHGKVYSALSFTVTEGCAV